jgi:pimeloyl-ACP methyl ester carboxylesterase
MPKRQSIPGAVPRLDRPAIAGRVHRHVLLTPRSSDNGTMSFSPAPELPAFIESMLPDGIERYLVPVGDQHMHVMELGQGRPVLMVHGNPTWGFLYRNVAAALADHGLRLIMPDLIGLGLSSKPRSMQAHQLEAHGTWLGQLIDTLQLDQLILVAQDWGGAIGLHALARRAQRVAGLVLCNTVISPPKPDFRPTSFHRLSRVPGVSDLLFRVAGFPQNVLALVQGERRSITRQAARAYQYPMRHLADRVAPLALARMVPDTLQHPSVPALRECQDYATSFTGPAALVWGERDPILGRVLGHVSRLLPHAEVTRTRAGHFLQEEVPGVIAQAIRSVAARAA